MSTFNKKPENSYVNDLRRIKFTLSQVFQSRSVLLQLGLSALFLAIVGIFVGSTLNLGDEALLIAVAAVIGGYMALNIGANDVANNMGPAVGGKVLSTMPCTPASSWATREHVSPNSSLSLTRP